MRRGIITMSQRERQRYHLLKLVAEGNITLHDAERLMAISYGHAKRLNNEPAFRTSSYSRFSLLFIPTWNI